MKYKITLIISIISIFFFNLGANSEPSENDKDLQKMHQYFSTKCFNRCWKYFEKKNLTAEDKENMILVANTSLWHWKQRNDLTPKNLSVAYWQLSRAYGLCNQAKLAKEYAEKCLDISLESELPPYFVGYAYRELANLYIEKENYEEAVNYLKKGYDLVVKVENRKDQGYLKGDLDKLLNLLPKKYLNDLNNN